MRNILAKITEIDSNSASQLKEEATARQCKERVDVVQESIESDDLTPKKKIKNARNSEYSRKEKEGASSKRVGGASTKLTKLNSHRKISERKMLKPKFAIVTESQRFTVSNIHLAKILRRFPHEVQDFMAGGELDDTMFDALFDHYLDEGEMPYGVAKARDGDPYEWIANKLHSDLEHGSMSQFAKKEEYAESEDMVDEMSKPQSIRAAAFRDPNAEKAKDAIWAQAKQKANGGSSGQNPFATPAPSYANPAFGASGERAGKARAGSGVWSGNFESVEGEELPMEEAVLMETPPEAIADALTTIGLDEGLDFFFENGELHIIGSHEARVAYNALVSSMNVTGQPSVSHLSGEEYIVTFEDEDDHDYANRLDDEQYDESMEVDEALSDVQKWRMAQMRGDATETGEKQMELDREYAMTKDPAQRAAIKKRMAQLAGERARMMASESTSENSQQVTEDAQLTINADGDDAVLNLIRKLSGLPEKEPIVAPDAVSMDDSMAMGMPLELGGVEDDVSVMPDNSTEMEYDDMNTDYNSDEYEPEEIETESEYANEPQPMVHTSTTAMINQGNDMNRSKKMGYPMRNLGNNPMAEARTLIRQYNADLKDIKK